MRLAYFVNQYPAVSHTFIRREIHALEADGWRIERFALYAQEDNLIDPLDQQELRRTQLLLRRNPLTFLRDTLITLVSAPLRFCRALGMALRQGYSSKSGLAKHLVYLSEACVLRRWLQRRQIQHVHAHFGTNGTHVVMLARLLGGPPYSFTVHGPEEFDDAPIISLRDKIRQAEFVVAVSSYGRSQLYRLCDRSRWSRVHVVRCGLPRDYGQAARPFAGHGRRLVCVGRLCEQKGQLLLVEAARCLQQRGVEFQLTLVGDGPLRAELETRIRQYQLTQHVSITGWCSGDEVRNQVLAARALVLPSFAEGLPVVLMEALALQRPVITTFIAGIPELVDRDCGWLIPAGCVESLTAALQDALEASPERIQQLGRLGAQRVQAHHDVQQEAARLAALFRQSIGGTARQ